jgi:hypothetical protein
MTGLPKVDRFESIPVDTIGFVRFWGAGGATHRHEPLPQGSIEKLEASIEKWGLLHPILVTPTGVIPGKEYELIAGVKRLLAHWNLGRETIQAAIILGPVTDEHGINLAANENIIRTDMTREHLIDLCTGLYHRYGTCKDVAEATAIPVAIVKKYVQY